MGRPIGTNTSTWQPTSGATPAQAVQPPYVRPAQRAPSQAQIAAFTPTVRPGYELQGPYNSMGQAAAQGHQYLTREELMARIGATPIAPAQTANPYAAYMGANSFMGVNPAMALAAAQARAAMPQAQGIAPPAQPTAMNGLGLSPQILAAIQARQAAPTAAAFAAPVPMAGMPASLGRTPAAIAAYNASQMGARVPSMVSLGIASPLAPGATSMAGQLGPYAPYSAMENYYNSINNANPQSGTNQSKS